METHLVSAPVPGGQDGQTKGHPCPWEVPCVGVSEHVHGVCTWQVAGGVDDGPGGNSLGIDFCQLLVSTDPVESWCERRGTGSGEWLAVPTAPLPCPTRNVLVHQT